MLLQRAQTPQYKSTAEVLVTHTGVETSSPSTNARTTGVVNLDTESNLVKSTAVVSRAKALLNTTDSLAEIVKRISVSVPANTDLLTIGYQGGTPATAQQGAAAVAAAYLANRDATAKAILASQIKVIQTNVTTTTAGLKKATADAAKFAVNTPERQFANAQRALLDRRLGSLSQQLVNRQSVIITPGYLAAAATLPTKAAGLSKTLFLASGLALGLLLGLFGAWLLARRPIRRLRRPTDIQQTIGVPVIARIDNLEAGRLTPASTPSAEAYRRLVNVVTASLNSGNRIVLVAGGDEKNQVSGTVTHNIAATLSRSGERVAVLRAGAYSDEADEADADEAVQPEKAYRILPSSGPRTRQAIEELRSHEDGFVIIDARDPLKTADAQSYGAVVDAVIIVLQARTPTRQAQRIVAEFDAVGAPVLGVVLVTMADQRKAVSVPSPARPSIDSARSPGAALSAPEAEPAGKTAPRPGPLRGGRRAPSATSTASRRVIRRNERARARAGRD